MHFSTGTFNLAKPLDVKSEMDAREILLTDIRERLLGRSMKATGSVIEAKQLYFIPRTVERVL